MKTLRAYVEMRREPVAWLQDFEDFPAGWTAKRARLHLQSSSTQVNNSSPLEKHRFENALRARETTCVAAAPVCRRDARSRLASRATRRCQSDALSAVNNLDSQPDEFVSAESRCTDLEQAKHVEFAHVVGTAHAVSVKWRVLIVTFKKRSPSKEKLEQTQLTDIEVPLIVDAAQTSNAQSAKVEHARRAQVVDIRSNPTAVEAARTGQNKQ